MTQQANIDYKPKRWNSAESKLSPILLFKDKIHNIKRHYSTNQYVKIFAIKKLASTKKL